MESNFKVFQLENLTELDENPTKLDENPSKLDENPTILDENIYMNTEYPQNCLEIV